MRSSSPESAATMPVTPQALFRSPHRRKGRLAPREVAGLAP